MKILYTFLSALFGILLVTPARAQNGWPKTFTTNDGSTVKIYQWQPESFSNNTLKANAAISVLEKGKSDPVFGMTWLTAQTSSNGDQVSIRSVNVDNIKVPGITNNDDLNDLAGTIESRVNSMGLSFASSELQSNVSMSQQQSQLSKEISNTPPKVIYSNAPAILVLMDGAPRLQQNKDWGMEVVVNSPFTIVKNNGGFFLYGGKHWYNAPTATGPYSLTTSTPAALSKVQQAIDEAARNNAGNNNGNNGSNPQQESDDNTIYKVIVSTEPAELVQSSGEANFASVEGTNLLYVSNSQNDIFMDISSQQYYVLLSGRWFRSKTLSGQWQYVPADQLPGEFAKIPAGSPKDNVLASVAGTTAAKDALLDAQVPQTAKVDRNQAHADVQYDGDPEFENIDGTDMAYAVNTSASVVRWNGMYYSVDNGVWFESRGAAGPWAVAVTRPYPVALIPPRYPVYYMKYVYIYDVTPDYVYMGYTPGYLNSYIYGPTIVYGTGFYYRPWYRNYYYPRPYTWGFGVSYNPWVGWGMSYGFSTGWFNMSFGFGPSYYGWGGGWWGPRMYRPPYCWSPYRFNGGYYGRNAYVYNRNTYIQYNNNIYRNRVGVVTRDNPRYVTPPNGRPGWGRPTASDRNPGYGTRPNNARPGMGQGSVRPDGGRFGGGQNNGGTSPDRTRPYNPGNTNPGNTRPGSETPGGRPGSAYPGGRPSNPNPGSSFPGGGRETRPSGPGSARPGNAYPGGRPSQPQQQMPSRPQPQSRPGGFERGGGGNGGGRPAESRPARGNGGGGERVRRG